MSETRTAWTSTPQIGALSAALSKAQAQIRGAEKNRVNPAFKSRYADLAAVLDACREALSAQGLAVMQPATSEGRAVTVTTILSHSSGEWIASSLTMEAQQGTPQAMGSCLSYARRYGLSSLVGVAPDEDDDGEAAHGRGAPAHRQEPRNDSRPSGAGEARRILTERIAKIADAGKRQEAADALKRAGDDDAKLTTLGQWVGGVLAAQAKAA